MLGMYEFEHLLGNPLNKQRKYLHSSWAGAFNIHFNLIEELSVRVNWGGCPGLCNCTYCYKLGTSHFHSTHYFPTFSFPATCVNVCVRVCECLCVSLYCLRFIQLSLIYIEKISILCFVQTAQWLKMAQNADLVTVLMIMFSKYFGINIQCRVDVI